MTEPASEANPKPALRVEGTDVNSVSRAGARNLLAVGDDFGRVRLLNYP